MPQHWKATRFSGPGGRISQSAGFTLIELLVSISVMAILLSIAVPVLFSARKTAIETVTLANQRQADQVLRLYLQDYDDQYPNWGQPGTFSAHLEWHGDVVADTWWNQPWYWGLYLDTLGYNGWASLSPESTTGAYERIAEEEGCAGCGALISWHVITNTAYAEPPFWDAQQVPQKRYHVALRSSQISFPSRKGILILRYGLYGRSRTLDREMVHFGDGHGEIILKSRLKPGVFRGGMDSDGMPVHNTVGGFLGRDL